MIGKVIITAFSQELENVFYEFKDRKYTPRQDAQEEPRTVQEHRGYSNERLIVVGEIERRRLSKLMKEEPR